MGILPPVSLDRVTTTQFLMISRFFCCKSCNTLPVFWKQISEGRQRNGFLEDQTERV